MRELQEWGEGQCLWAEPSSSSKIPNLLAVLNDLEKQPEEGKEVAPPAEVKIKTHNQVIQNNPCLSSTVTASHLTSLGLSFLTCHEEQCGAPDGTYMQTATTEETVA